MKEKTGTNRAETILLPDYGKRKLLLYAHSFEELADTFTRIAPAPAAQEKPDMRQNSVMEQKPAARQEDRQGALWQRRFQENRELLAEHLKEAAQIMSRIAQESYEVELPDEREKRRLVHALKEQGIVLRDIFIMENEQDRLQISMTMKSRRAETFTVEEIAGFLSVLFEKRLVAEKNSVFFLKDVYETVIFEEEAPFSILTGMARAIKENEKVSGDNYSFLEVNNGAAMMALSDGMGSGEKACRDSELVIELLEKCVESGFSKETAIQIINGILIARAEDENMSTLDICEVDLYTGTAQIIKIGSSYTYIKKESAVEQIPSTTLPLGLFHRQETENYRRSLQEGDAVIMLSDGVVDSIQSDSRDEILKELIGALHTKNSRELANNILQFALHQSGGRVRDDMTVLVLSLWESH